MVGTLDIYFTTRDIVTHIYKIIKSKKYLYMLHEVRRKENYGAITYRPSSRVVMALNNLNPNLVK